MTVSLEHKFDILQVFLVYLLLSNAKRPRMVEEIGLDYLGLLPAAAARIAGVNDSGLIR